MKILGGLYKGSNLFSPVGADVRPALARMKNSLFNILSWQLEGKSVLDLFAGTGSLGLEALSRGARHCLFIENNSTCIDAIQKSIAKLRLGNSAKVVLMDSFNIVPYVQQAGARFDYVFIDPPYKYYDEPAQREKLLRVIRQLAEKEIIMKSGIIIVEHRDNKADENALNNLEWLERVDLRNYGQTSLSFLKSKKQSNKGN